MGLRGGGAEQVGLGGVEMGQVEWGGVGQRGIDLLAGEGSRE